MTHPYKYRAKDGRETARSRYAEGGPVKNDDPVFNIESRDYSKHPASLGEKIYGTAKIIAEPYARTIRNAYRAYQGK